MLRWLARELAKNDKSLVGFWPLAGNLLDYSGQAAHVVKTSGLSNYNSSNLSFDGLNYYAKYIDDPSFSSVPYGNNSISISFWMIPPASNPSVISYKYIIRIGNTTSGHYLQLGYKLSSINTFIAANGTGGYFEASSYALASGGLTWNHCVFTFDGSTNTWSLYVNGALRASYQVGYLNTVIGQWFLGADPVLNQGGAVKLSDFRIYAKLLSSDEVTSLYNNGCASTQNNISNLASWYKMDEGTGSIINDSIPGPSAAMYGTFGGSSVIPQWEQNFPICNASTSLVSGFISNSSKHGFYFNGNTYLSSSNISPILYNNFSTSFWYLPAAINAGGTIVSTDNLSITISNTGTISFKLIDNNNANNFFEYKGNFDISLHKWYHFIITYNSNGATIYVNGRPIGPASQTNFGTTPTFNINSIVTIGQGISNAILRLIRLFNRTLNNQLDITKLYAREVDTNIARSDPYIGLPHPANNSFTLVMNATAEPGLFTHFPLVINGKGLINSGVPLYIGGKLSGDNNFPMVINGVTSSARHMNLFMKGQIPTPGHMAMPLNIIGASSGTINQRASFPMVISTSGIPQHKNEDMNLFMKATDVGQTVRHMNMSIGGKGYTVSNSAPLFLNNLARGAPVTLTIIGSGHAPGILTGKPLNLFIRRNPSNAFTLFIPVATPATSTTPLHISSVPSINNNVPLSMARPKGQGSGEPTLFISGF